MEVLIVDDGVQSRELLSEFCRAHGYDVGHRHDRGAATSVGAKTNSGCLDIVSQVNGCALSIGALEAIRDTIVSDLTTAFDGQQLAQGNDPQGIFVESTT